MENMSQSDLKHQLTEFSQKYENKIPIIENIKGCVLQNRFHVKERLGEGAYGIIFKGYDMLTPMY
jgi:hypothetical protein